MRFDVHSLSQIKSMGVESLDARQEPDVIAILAASMIDDPVEQLPAVPFRTIAILCDEVVDLEILPTVQPFADAYPGDGFHITGILDVDELEIECIHLSSDPRNEILLGDMRTELRHDRVAALDLGIGLGEGDGHCIWKPG